MSEELVIEPVEVQQTTTPVSEKPKRKATEKQLEALAKARSIRKAMMEQQENIEKKTVKNLKTRLVPQKKFKKPPQEESGGNGYLYGGLFITLWVFAQNIQVVSGIASFFKKYVPNPLKKQVKPLEAPLEKTSTESSAPFDISQYLS